MTYTKVAEINCATGEETVREMNADEKKDYDLRAAAQKQGELDLAQTAADKAALLAKLAALGLTTNDLKALGLGTN